MSILTNTVSTVKTIITEPKTFFPKLKKEPLRVPLGFAALILIPYTILAGIFSVLSQIVIDAIANSIAGTTSQFAINSVGYGIGLLFIPFQYLGSIVGLFIGAGLLWLVFKLLGVHGSYARFFQVNVYANTPVYVYGWIPLISLLAWIHSIILLVYGMMQAFNISMGRAIVGAVVIPFILVLAFYAIIFFIIFAIIGTLGFTLLGFLG